MRPNQMSCELASVKSKDSAIQQRAMATDISEYGSQDRAQCSIIAGSTHPAGDAEFSLGAHRIDHLMQAVDVAATMQHCNTFRNERAAP
jgi:hypothetical protein